jgi:hypothetical protein
MINKKKISEITELRVNEMIKECYWDYSITADEIIDIAYGDDLRKKQKLFEKIIYNSSHKYLLLTTIFDTKTLLILFNNMKINYNAEFITRQTIMLRNLLFGEENVIKVLEWKKR